MEFVIEGRQPVLRAAEQPVGHGLPGKHDALPVPFLLLPVQRGAHHEFLHGDVGDCFRRRIAAGDQHRLLRRLQDRRGYAVCFAVPAAIGIVDIPMQDERTAPSVILAATRLLYHLSRVFRDAIPAEAAGHGLRMDRKRLRELAEQKGRRAAMNYAREEQEGGGPTMTVPW